MLKGLALARGQGGGDEAAAATQGVIESRRHEGALLTIAMAVSTWDIGSERSDPY
jgi:hypothetical protein